MDFRQLEIFVATVEKKSFSGAASALYISQPTISAHIHALEKELHTKLIDRTTKSFEVTAEGRRLYDHAVAMLQLQRKVISELDSFQKKELHIGASSVPGQRLLPKMLAEFHQLAPDIVFHTTLSGSVDIIRKVEQGSLDVGLVGTVIDAQCTFVPIALDELVLAAPNTPYYRRLQKQNAPLETLLREPFLLRSDDSGTKLETERFLQRAQMSLEDLNVIAYVNDAEMLYNHVIQGLGVTLMSKRMAETHGWQKKLIVFSQEEPILLRKLYLICRKGAYLSKAAEQFIRLAEKQIPKELLCGDD